MNKILILSYIVFVLASCSADKKQGNSAEQIKTETQNTNKKNQKPTISKTKAQNKKTGKSNYYKNLKQSINLTDIQVKKLKGNAIKYDRKLKAIPKNKTQLIKQTKAQKQQEIKRILGEKLYLKKVEFDKKL